LNQNKYTTDPARNNPNDNCSAGKYFVTWNPESPAVNIITQDTAKATV